MAQEVQLTSVDASPRVITGSHPEVSQLMERTFSQVDQLADLDAFCRSETNPFLFYLAAAHGRIKGIFGSVPEPKDFSRLIQLKAAYKQIMDE